MEHNISSEKMCDNSITYYQLNIDMFNNNISMEDDFSFRLKSSLWRLDSVLESVGVYCNSNQTINSNPLPLPKRFRRYVFIIL